MSELCSNSGLFKIQRQVAIFILSLLVFTNITFGLDYTIKEVIEVGEADFVPFLGPLKWSPDGTKLAFFKNGILKFSDTLGNVSQIADLGVAPHKYDWISNDKIVVHFRIFPGPSIHTQEKLVSVDVGTGQLSIIHEFNTAPGYRKEPGKTTSSGPYETVEGNKFYLYTTYNPESGKTTVERKSFLDNKTALIENEHIARWGQDGLYLVTLRETDSIKITNKLLPKIGSFPKVNFDFTFVYDSRFLIDLNDSSLIVFDTMFGDLPPNTVQCGIVSFSFNPITHEAVFTISCDDGHNYVNHRIATFDCSTLELKIIDPLIGKSECAAPVFSPDGRKIAFMSKNRAYILTREIT